MRARLLAALMLLAIADCSSGSHASASPPAQNKRSKSDADINTIGHRRIVDDANFYSPAKEKELGKQLSAKVDQNSKLLKDPAIEEYIGRVAQNVAKNSDAQMPIAVLVLDTDAVEAFTLPGGYQYVTRGLLRSLDGEAELASIMARGIAHTALRSATRLATKEQIIQIAGVPTPSTTGGTFLEPPLATLKIRRDDEFDADYFGVQYLYKAGYDPRCFTEVVQRIWGNSSTAGAKVPKVFSSFPPLDERLAALRKEISTILPPRADAIASTPEFDLFKERLRAKNAEGPEPKTTPED
jgi:predicted Zn-dependent protease